MLEKLQSDIVDAIKSGEKEKVSVLRMLVSEIKNLEIDLKAGGKELDDELISQVLSKEAKKRKDSIEAFQNAGRNEMVENEKQELEIIQSYLPEQMSRDDIAQIVEEVVSGMDSQDFGLVMKEVMSRVKGRADGKVVSEAVRERLQ